MSRSLRPALIASCRAMLVEGGVTGRLPLTPASAAGWMLVEAGDARRAASAMRVALGYLEDVCREERGEGEVIDAND